MLSRISAVPHHAFSNCLYLKQVSIYGCPRFSSERNHCFVFCRQETISNILVSSRRRCPRLVLYRSANGSAISTAHGIEFKTSISCGGAVITSDMPTEGDEPRKSPSPKDLVMAGLASCTSMTIQVLKLCGFSLFVFGDAFPPTQI